MIDLNKKYKTVSGKSVVLNEIFGNKVYGRVYNGMRWKCCEWCINGQYEMYQINQELDLEEIPYFAIEEVDILDKNVKYHNSFVVIPTSIQWLAVDCDGGLYGYAAKPEIGRYSWEIPAGSPYIELGTVNYQGDWKQSLVKV